MCIGIPMRITALENGYAWCEGMGEYKRVDLLLTGPLPVDSWVLVFLNSAREVLSEAQAKQITDAVMAVNLVMQGETQFQHLFADLMDREPELPEFLRTPQPKESA